MVFLRGIDGYFGDMVFACFNGVRRHVLDIQVLPDYGFSWPLDVVDVPDSVVFSYRNGGWLPKKNFPDGLKSASNIHFMRDFVSSGLKGCGVEFGAGANPFPVPIETYVFYADKFSTIFLKDHHYNKKDVVVLDFNIDVENFDFPDESLDFCILCHVIEHLKNPILALENVYKKLKKNGFLILVIPDKNKTFDRDRELTTIEHLIDHYTGKGGGCLEHYVDYYKNVMGLSGVELNKKATYEFKNGGDIHFHTWTYQSFSELMDFVVSSSVAKFSEVKGYDVDLINCPEFYFILKK